EELYMEQPEGFDTGDRRVCKLRKSLYGLKQAGRAWYAKIDKTFTSLGYTQSNADHGIYTKDEGGIKTIITLYIDDIVIACNDKAELVPTKQELNQIYDMKDLGELHYCLGLQITRDRKARTISISQTRYIENILEKYNM